jgi:hypothetical protein
MNEGFAPPLLGYVNKFQLKRQHSAEPMNQAGSVNRGVSGSPISGTPVSTGDATAEASTAAKPSVPDLSTEGTVGSPFKKHRASLPGFDDGVRKSLGATLANAAQKERGNSEGSIPAAPSIAEAKMEEDEEL